MATWAVRIDDAMEMTRTHREPIDGEPPSLFGRRDFLKGAAAAAAGLSLACAGCGDVGDSLLTPGAGRLAIAMWEFSWLVRRQGSENEYEDWDRVLDELAGRGYGAVRIDAFPHLVAAGPGGERVDRFTILPQPRGFFWGNHESVEVEPRPGLAAFIRKARARGLRVGLSTWLNDDTLHRRDTIATPADFARVWGETLDFLAGESLLDAIDYVDLLNEFPLGVWAPAAYRAMFGTSWPNPLPLVTPWGGKRRGAVQAYFDEGIGPLRAACPELRYTFSFQRLGSENIRSLDFSSFDLVEAHVWLAETVEFALRSGAFYVQAQSPPEALALHARLAPDLYASERDHWIALLAERMDLWAEWAGAKGLPLYSTEAWASINYDDLPPVDDASEWDWLKDLCAEGVRMAVEKGWKALCTSNFCQPHFEGMWADIGWHRDLTKAIRAR